MRSTLNAALVLLVVCAAVPVGAGEGRTPIWQPTVITVDGRYILTRDVTGTVGGAVIQVATGLRDVEIDLNGFTILGSPFGGEPIRATGVTRLTVRNGTLQGQGGAGDGVYVEDAQQVIIENVKARNNGGAAFMLIRVGDVTLRRNTILDSAGFAIVADPSSAAGTDTQGVIEENSIRDCPAGISIKNAVGLAIRNNRIEEPFAGEGIDVVFCDGAQITGNTIRKAGTFGLDLAHCRGALVQGNVVVESGFDGISIVGTGDDSLVLENVSTGNLGHGMAVATDRCHIERNVLNANQDFGLHLAFQTNDVVYRGNTARGNGGTTCSGVPSLPDFCDDGFGNSTEGDNWMPARF